MCETNRTKKGIYRKFGRDLQNCYYCRCSNEAEPFDNVILPLSSGQGIPHTPITGHDAVISHLLCVSPDQMLEIAKGTKSFMWEAGKFGPKIPNFLLPQLQVCTIGRKKKETILYEGK